MKQYELSYLISPELSNEEVIAFSEKMNSVLQDNGAVLGKLSAEKKIKLGYPIKKKVGAFIKTITFHLAPNKIIEVEKILKEQPEILRYFILCPKKIKVVEKELVFKTAQKLTEEAVVEEKTKEKVEFKDIDAKLEEILDE
ncbi:30S ribosomal protein S6 [Patescibacteria group bacterium]|nr:30S ribosomal protein S6 [Patescibacteria group bacterium]MBU1877197.1 30S ribosomal protein S6 [Patescibacteria group bacterium]